MPVLLRRSLTATYLPPGPADSMSAVGVTRRRTPMLFPVSVIVSPRSALAGFGGWWYSSSTSSLLCAGTSASGVGVAAAAALSVWCLSDPQPHNRATSTAVAIHFAKFQLLTSKAPRAPAGRPALSG